MNTPASSPEHASAAEQPPDSVRYAAYVVLAQAAALLIITVVLLVLAGVHSSQRLWAALAIAGFALLGALICYLCARGLLGLRPSSRSPVVLLELLALPVGFSLGIQAGRPLAGIPVLVSALAVLALLCTPSARAALNRML